MGWETEHSAISLPPKKILDFHNIFILDIKFHFVANQAFLKFQNIRNKMVGPCFLLIFYYNFSNRP